MITVALTFAELRRCYDVGTARFLSARAQNFPMDKGRKDFGIEGDCNGACGEFVTSKVYGIEWNPVTHTTDTLRGDVGLLQVKTVLGENDRLLIRPQDPEDMIYILCRMPSFDTVQLKGWCWGHWAKQPCHWWKGITKGCYAIESELLKPIESLKAQPMPV
jgi:hypothetical protein